MKTKEPKSKVTLLSEARDKKAQKEAEQRGSILLNKSERREIQGFKARQREIDNILGPLQADVNEFLNELQERYPVKIGVTHSVNFDTFELTPMPEKKEEPEAPEAT